MAREIAVVQKLAEAEALKLIEAQLQRGPRRGGKADAADVEAEIEASGEIEGDIEQAA
jgi:CarD family transcriptional regulator